MRIRGTRGLAVSPDRLWQRSDALQVSQVGAKHVSHGVRIGFNLSGSSGSLRELLSNRTERRRDQVGGQCAGRFRGLGQDLSHKNLDDTLARSRRLPRFGRVTIKGRGITERDAHRGLIALRADESVNECA